MARRWRRAATRGVVAIALAGALVPVAASAATRPTSVPTLELAGQTVIHWHGSTVVRIHAAKNVLFRDNGGVRLISHGHYAFIRIDPTSLCQHYVPHCGTGMIDWTPSIGDGLYGKDYAAHHGGPGTDIAYAIQDPEGLTQGWSVFYLASDGESTLELTTPNLAGRREVRLTNRARIVVQRLPMKCLSTVPVPCDGNQGYGSRLLFGGAAHDVGRSGFAQAIVINAEGSDQTYGPNDVPHVQPLGLVGCVYGPGMSVSQDPAAADHPTGCDVASKSLDETDVIEASQLGFTSVYPAGGQGFWRGDGQRRGPTYLGYIIDDPVSVPQPKWREAWGIWFPYATS